MGSQAPFARRAGLRPPAGERKGRRQDTVEAVSGTGLWEGLPEELVEHVLAFLPVPSIFRASAVCKKWNALVFSARFKERCSQVPPQRPWLVTMAEGKICQAYSPVENKWSKLPWGELSGNGILVAGGSGLLCFQTASRTFREISLLVVNPVSKYVKPLPPCLRLGWTESIALEVEEKTFPLVYRVLVFFCTFCKEGRPRVVTGIFDSGADGWRLSTSACPVPGCSVLDLAVSAGSVYCVVRTPSRDDIVAYNIRQDLWTIVETPNWPSWCFYRLLDCQGQLMLLVGGTLEAGGDPDARASDRNARVWVYCRDRWTREWEKLDQMPARFRHRLLKGEVSECAGGSKGEVYLAAHSRRSEFVKYDESLRSWMPLPSCSDLRNVANLQVVSFEPRWGA